MIRFDTNKLKAAIDEWSMDLPEEDIRVQVPQNSKKKREHLGLSNLGNDCVRAVFYDWRKISDKKFPPRLYRLFQRGHREEFFFMHMLRGVGLKIYEHDPKTGKQFKVSDFEGHLQGSMDGIARDRKLLFINKDVPFKTEYKTYNDKRFNILIKEGVKEADPKYYGQIQGYMGYEERIKGCLFCAVNKNDDSLHFEWILPDASTFSLLRDRAEEIINAKAPPVGISRRKSYWKCKFCDFKDHCFLTDKNRKSSKVSCRSCVHGSPALGGTWECDKGNEFGTPCEQWKDING